MIQRPVLDVTLTLIAQSIVICFHCVDNIYCAQNIFVAWSHINNLYVFQSDIKIHNRKGYSEKPFSEFLLNQQNVFDRFSRKLRLIFCCISSININRFKKQLANVVTKSQKAEILKLLKPKGSERNPARCNILRALC